MLKGITITYVHKIKIDENAFGEPIYADHLTDSEMDYILDYKADRFDMINEAPEYIHNVLVAPVMQTGIPEQEYLEKKKKMKILGIPKGDMHDWKDCTVIIDGERYQSVGYPEEGIEALVPGPWHKKVTVQTYE